MSIFHKLVDVTSSIVRSFVDLLSSGPCRGPALAMAAISAATTICAPPTAISGDGKIEPNKILLAGDTSGAAPKGGRLSSNNFCLSRPLLSVERRRRRPLVPFHAQPNAQLQTQATFSPRSAANADRRSAGYSAASSTMDGRLGVAPAGGNCNRTKHELSCQNLEAREKREPRPRSPRKWS